jgi:hypothetical protein
MTTFGPNAHPRWRRAKTREYTWTTHQVIDFVNWYLRVKRIGVNKDLENMEIIHSFRRGDAPEVWHQGGPYEQYVKEKEQQNKQQKNEQ